MDGLNSLVQDTIQSRGDSPLPDKGLVFSSNSAAVAARSAFPGTKDLTYGTMAALLRGIWEIATLFGPFELDMDIYIGSQDHTHYHGHLALYLTDGSRETA